MKSKMTKPKMNMNNSNKKLGSSYKATAVAMAPKSIGRDFAKRHNKMGY